MPLHCDSTVSDLPNEKCRRKCSESMHGKRQFKEPQSSRQNTRDLYSYEGMLTSGMPTGDNRQFRITSGMVVSIFIADKMP